MTNADDARILKQLQSIPNVGPVIAGHLLRLGLHSKADLAVEDPCGSFERLCAMDGRQYDPCLEDVFTAAVHFSRGNPPRPWWEFTPSRKARRARYFLEPPSALSSHSRKLDGSTAGPAIPS